MTDVPDLPFVERGSMVLLTERTRELGPHTCETCGAAHRGGLAHSVVVQEHDAADAQWLLWVFNDGFSVSDETSGAIMAACSACQAVPVVRILRFADAANAERLPGDLSAHRRW